MLGTVTYTEADLLSILQEAPAGNGLVTLAHQLIAAKLNIEGGASASSISATIAAADAKIGALIVPPVPPATGTLAPADTSALVDELTAFNEGSIGPGSCE